MYRLLHLQSRRTDREEIRRRLAMGGDEEYYGNERAMRKPSLQTRLQGGMNLQLCFMNDLPPEVAVPNGDGTEVAVPEAMPTQETTKQVSAWIFSIHECCAM